MRVKDINMPHVQVTQLNRFETYLSQIPILVLKFVAFTDSIAESICTLYSNLSGRPDIFLGSGTLKKQGPKYGVQKAGCKKQGHCYSKKEEAAALFSF